MFEAWNKYTAACKQAWSQHPPKTSDCGRFWVFSEQYEAKIAKAKADKDATLSKGIANV